MRSIPHHWAWSLVLMLVASQVARAQGGLPPAREVIARHVEAVGGEAALQRVRSRKVWAKYEIPARRLRGTLELFSARPDKYVLKIEYPEAGTDVTGYDGSAGWSKKPGETWKQIHGSELDELRDLSIYDFDLHPEDRFRSIETLDISRFENRDCFRLRLVSTTGRQWEEYFDVESGLFAGQLFRRVTPKGEVTVKIVATRYQLHDGIRLPMRLSYRSAGVEQLVTVLGIEYNRVDASVFDFPKPRPRGSR